VFRLLLQLAKKGRSDAAIAQLSGRLIGRQSSWSQLEITAISPWVRLTSGHMVFDPNNLADDIDLSRRSNYFSSMGRLLHSL
jgi:hypothetical protein